MCRSRPDRPVPRTPERHPRQCPRTLEPGPSHRPRRSTGARRWTYEVGDWGPARVCAGTAVGGALVCVGQAGPVGTDTLVAINLADGLEVARQPVSIDANSVTVVGDDVVLGAYDAATQEFLAQRIN